MVANVYVTKLSPYLYFTNFKQNWYDYWITVFLQFRYSISKLDNLLM